MSLSRPREPGLCQWLANRRDKVNLGVLGIGSTEDVAMNAAIIVIIVVAAAAAAKRRKAKKEK
jgi:hypothetical protein